MDPRVQARIVLRVDGSHHARYAMASELAGNADRNFKELNGHEVII
jgi:hypothetical protein